MLNSTPMPCVSDEPSVQLISIEDLGHRAVKQSDIEDILLHPCDYTREFLNSCSSANVSKILLAILHSY